MRTIKAAVAESTAMAQSAEQPVSVGARHQSLQAAVTRSLRDAIVTGRLQPGERLRESQLAQMFQVSRNPVREALLALQAEGLVATSPRKGARVRLISEEEVAELIELRIELERLNARKTAQRGDEKLRQALASLVDEGNEAVHRSNREHLRELNDRFHSLVEAAAQNRYLSDYVRALREKTLWLFASARDDRAIETWNEHAAIAQAIIRGDAELAALLAARHVKDTGDWVRAQLSEAELKRAGSHGSTPPRREHRAHRHTAP